MYTGETASEYSGYAVSGAGDVNGDGYHDFVIGAYNKSDVGSGAGAVYLVYGSASDPSSSVNLGSMDNAVELSGQTAGDYAGYSVAGGGDVNADGYDDLLVGAYGYDNGSQTDAGRVYLIYGSSTPLASQALGAAGQVTFTATNLNSYLGRSVAFAGDLNGDGFDDMVLGASGFVVSAGNDGAAFVVYGSSATLTSKNITDSSIIQLSGEEGGSFAGWSVAGGGDVNADGYDDFLVGAYGYVGSVGPNAGATYIVYGQAATLTAASLSTHTRLAGESAGIQLGYSVSAAGDINGDGYDDFLIGASNSNAGAVGAGAVYVVYGSASTLSSLTMTSANSVRLVSLTAGETAGVGLGTAGDLNADGYDDFIVGAPSNDSGADNAGLVYVILGSADQYTSTDLTSLVTSSGGATLSGATIGDNLGQSAALVGDRDNNGSLEVLIGAYGLNVTTFDEGGTYLLTPFVDEDGDGESAEGSLIGGTDTDDTIANNGIEISGNGTDDDDDGSIDEVNTLAENGIHPGYGSVDPTSKADFLATVTSITPKKKGRILVTYADDSVFRYNIFPNFTGDKKVVVKSFRNRGLVNILHPKGKALRLINVYTGAQLSSKKLSTQKTYTSHSIKNLDVRDDGKVEVVVTSKKQADVRVSVVKVNMSTQKLKLYDTASATQTSVAPSKTTVRKKKILLKDSSGKVVLTFFVTKAYVLQQI